MVGFYACPAGIHQTADEEQGVFWRTKAFYLQYYHTHPYSTVDGRLMYMDGSVSEMSLGVRKLLRCDLSSWSTAPGVSKPFPFC